MSEVELIQPLTVIPENRPIGAPGLYNQDIAERICVYIAQGGNLTRFINENGGSPSHPTVYRWLETHEEFNNNYSRAHIDRSYYRADTIDNICQSVADSTLSPDKAKVIISAFQWQAGKEQPKRYGESSLVKLADADGNKLTFGAMMAEIEE